MCSARQAANDAPMAFLFVINGMYVRDVVRVMHVGAFIALRTRCALVCCTSILRIRFQSISSNFLQLFCNCNYRSWCNGTCVVFAISSCSSVGVCMALEMWASTGLWGSHSSACKSYAWRSKLSDKADAGIAAVEKGTVLVEQLHFIILEWTPGKDQAYIVLTHVFNHKNTM